MIVLPLGLGTKLRRVPVVTLTLVLLWVGVFLVERSSDHVLDGIFAAVAKSGLRDASRKLFVEYCQSRGGKGKTCAEYSVLIWPGFPAEAGSAAGDWRRNPSAAGHDSLLKKMNTPAMLAETEKAEKLKSKLQECSHSRSCYLYKDILWNFLDSHRVETRAMKRLKNYRPYSKAQNLYRKNLVRVCATERCLVKGNINGPSLAAAQLRHSGFMHLFSNLAAFIIFGIYVEQRTNRFVYLATIVLGGTIGMAIHAAYFGNGDTIALGGSANVSAVMGMFLVFFYRCRMSFLVWLPRKAYFGTRFFADVKYCFPLLFVLSDISGGFDSGFASVASGRVAHFAHLSGLAVGMLIAYLVTLVRRLPSPFIYESEMGDMMQLEKSRDMAHILQRATDMVRVNPDNVHAMEVAVTNFLRWAKVGEAERNAPLFHSGRQFLIEHLQTVCAINAKKGEMRYACKILSQIPLYMPYRIYLANLGQVNVLRLGDFALSQGHPMLALRLYDFFLTKFPLSVKVPSVESTAAQLLDSLPPSTENVNSLMTFLTYHPESMLAPRIGAEIANVRVKSA